MRARVRGPNGQATMTLAATATVGDLVKEISKITGLTSFEIRCGFPPKPLGLEQYSDKQTPLLNLEVNIDGETLTVTEKADSNTSSGTQPASSSTTGSTSQPKNPVSSAPTSSSSSSSSSTKPSTSTESAAAPAAPLSLKRKETSALATDAPEIPMPSHNGTLVMRVMPDDNSCLFRAFSSAILGSAELDSMHELRSIVASAIQADPHTYNSVVLERSPDSYCRWIQTPDAWGGGIELGILAQHFDVEVATIDVQTNAVTRFSHGAPATRVILVYSGIHYDVIALSPGVQLSSLEDDRKVFDTSPESADEEIMDKALQLCAVLRDRGYYTDTQGFLVRCNVCGHHSTGQEEVQRHAQETGHMDFQEAD